MESGLDMVFLDALLESKPQIHNSAHAMYRISEGSN